jgi:hypothetical protein
MDAIFQQVRLVFESENVISTSWLSSTFQMTTAAAIQYITQLRAEESGLHATYLLCGQDSNGGIKYTVVPEQELEIKKAGLSAVYSAQIFSVAKTDIASTSSAGLSTALASFLVNACLSQADVLLRQTSVNEAKDKSFLYNGFGTISYPDLAVKPVGERFLSALNKGNGSHTSTTVPVLSTTPASSASKAAVQAKAFFATASKTNPVAKASTVPVNVPTSAASTAQDLIKSPSKEAKDDSKRLKKRPINDDSEEEWEDEGASMTVRKRVPVVVKPEAESTSKESVESGSSSDEAEPEKRKKSKRAKKDLLTRGAMDDYIEDVAITQHKQQEHSVGEEPVKKKSKKLIEKVTRHHSLDAMATELSTVWDADLHRRAWILRDRDGLGRSDG